MDVHSTMCIFATTKPNHTEHRMEEFFFFEWKNMVPDKLHFLDDVFCTIDTRHSYNSYSYNVFVETDAILFKHLYVSSLFSASIDVFIDWLIDWIFLFLILMHSSCCMQLMWGRGPKKFNHHVPCIKCICEKSYTNFLKWKSQQLF